MEPQARNPTSNYAFKPTAEQALGLSRGSSCRGGLARRLRYLGESDFGREPTFVTTRTQHNAQTVLEVSSERVTLILRHL